MIDNLATVSTTYQRWLTDIIKEVLPAHCDDVIKLLKELKAKQMVEKLEQADTFDASLAQEVNTGRRHKKAG